MTSEETVDVVLIGGGIMSATLGSLISQLQPDWSIRVYERLGEVAQESSNAWNNAGTGHAALCELNYMPENPDGSVSAAKAVSINFDSRDEVDAALADWLTAGGEVSKHAEETEWGGYSGYGRDPDGNLWEFAHNPFWPLDDAGMPQLDGGEVE